MAKVFFAPAARDDLFEIFEDISSDNPGAASNWIDKIEEKCDLIAISPNLGESRPELGDGIRSSFVGRYVIFYRAIRVGIEVIRVIAGDRDIRVL